MFITVVVVVTVLLSWIFTKCRIS